MIEATIMLSIPFAFVGWYLLLSDPTDNRSFWTKFHRMMKAGRIQKVCKLAGVNKTSSENKSQ